LVKIGILEKNLRKIGLAKNLEKAREKVELLAKNWIIWEKCGFWNTY
jgi:hypothetical protein